MFNIKDVVFVNVDVVVLYQFDCEKVLVFYINFCVDCIEMFMYGYLCDIVCNVIVVIGFEYNFDDVNGGKKEEFVVWLINELDVWFVLLGVLIKQFGIVGLLCLLCLLFDVVSVKIKVIQDVICIENEVCFVQVEVKKKVVIVEGEVVVNYVFVLLLDDCLLVWECLKFE